VGQRTPRHAQHALVLRGSISSVPLRQLVTRGRSRTSRTPRSPARFDADAGKGKPLGLRVARLAPTPAQRGIDRLATCRPTNLSLHESALA
jgi:hypothetical protein